MENGEHLSLEQIQAFLTGNKEIEFKAPNRKELYERTQQALCAQSYCSLHRAGCSDPSRIRFQKLRGQANT
jgi:hypothetical protein